MKKAKLLTTLAAVALIGAIGVGSTFAYLSSKTETVVNTFTVGNVVITLDEKDTDNSTPNAERDQANAYADMIPGSSYEKDPTVHVAANSENCYVFVKVTGLDANANALEINNFNTNLVKADGNTASDGIYRYNAVVTKSKNVQDIVVFNGFTLKSNVVGGTTITNITVEACAVQAGNLNETTALTQAKTAAGWN